MLCLELKISLFAGGDDDSGQGICKYNVILNNNITIANFYEMIIDETEGRINYHPIEIESEWYNCFGTIST